MAICKVQLRKERLRPGIHLEDFNRVLEKSNGDPTGSSTGKIERRECIMDIMEIK